MTIAIYTYAFSIYRGIGNFKIYNGIQIAYSILTIIPLFFISYLSLFQLFLLWSCICLTFNGFVFYKGMKQKIKTFLRLTKYPIVKVKIREVFKYSSPRLLGDFFLFSLTSFPILYIGYKSDLTTVSYFSVGMFFVKMIQPLFSFLGIILLPYVSNCFAVKQVDKAASLIHKILVIEIIVALVIVLLLYWFMPFWIRIFFSATYGESEECAKVLLLSIFPTVLYLLYRNPIDAVSVFPYNTLLLFVVFCLLLLSFYYSETMMQYAWSYVVISWTKGIGSYVCWNTLKNKKYGV